MTDDLVTGIEVTGTDGDDAYRIDLSECLSGWEMLSDDLPGYDADEPVRPAALPHPPAEYTYVGVDLGVRNVLAAAPASASATDPVAADSTETERAATDQMATDQMTTDQMTTDQTATDSTNSDRTERGAIPNTLTVDGAETRALFEELCATLDRLDASARETSDAESRAIRAYHDRLVGRIDAAVGRFLDYCDRFEGPLTVVMEDFGYDDRSVIGCTWGECDVGSWLLPHTRHRLAAALTARDVRVTYVDPAGTTSACHVCGEPGHAERAFTCTTEDCPVGTVDRDRNAAVNVALGGELCTTG